MDRNPDSTERISLTDACARFGGVVLLVLVGYAHLLDLSHKIDEGVWYMAFAFIGLIAASIIVAFLLVRLPAASVRLAWLAAVALCAGALFGYVVSRMVPLPGLADHAGEWISTYGAAAFLAETGLIGLAAFAMRDLTVRGVRHEPPAALRLPSLPAWPTAIVAAAVVSLHAAPALAHGGEEDEAATATATGKTTGGGGGETAAATGASAPAGHGEPFLGTFELSVALLLSLAFLTWTVRDLYLRTA